MAKAVDVARRLIYLAESQSKTLTNMQLQKLVYIAHGLHLAFHDEELLDEEINAWKHGPVIPDVYYEFRQYLDRNIPASEGAKGSFTDNEIDTIRTAYNNFGKFNGWTLREITHKKGSPWYSIWYDGNGKETYNAVIPNETIKNHYLKIKSTGKANIL